MIHDLAAKYHWPDEKPNIAPLDQGWFSGEKFFLEHLVKPISIIIELGSWLGKSTRFFLANYPAATVVAIDHWKGSQEHQIRFKERLPLLYDTFLVNCWSFKHRLIPLRNNTLQGLKEVSENCVVPNFIYVDAGHSYQEVVSDITQSISLFPTATIGGDDWLWGKAKPVQKAVRYCAEKFGKKIKYLNNNWIYV